MVGNDVDNVQTALDPSPLFALNALRGTYDLKVEAVVAAQKTVDDAKDKVKAAAADVVTQKDAELKAIQACEQSMFDAYTVTQSEAKSARSTLLEDIEKLLAANVAAIPARGAAGSRCEKALSNGTMRAARVNGAPADVLITSGGCAEGLCCGAAIVRDDKDASLGPGSWKTIETCQKADASTYGYVPMRAPMAKTMPTAVDVDWTCITGAKKLAAAASALAAAVYVLA